MKVKENGFTLNDLEKSGKEGETPC